MLGTILESEHFPQPTHPCQLPTPGSSNIQQNTLNGPESQVVLAQIVIVMGSDQKQLCCFLLKFLQSRPWYVYVCMCVCDHRYLVDSWLLGAWLSEDKGRGQEGLEGEGQREAETTVKPRDLAGGIGML